MALRDRLGAGVLVVVRVDQRLVELLAVDGQGVGEHAVVSGQEVRLTTGLS